MRISLSEFESALAKGDIGRCNWMTCPLGRIVYNLTGFNPRNANQVSEILHTDLVRVRKFVTDYDIISGHNTPESRREIAIKLFKEIWPNA